jgi:hypothetical protein
MPELKRVNLSASTIETFQTCSFIYFANRILGVPDLGNEGSSRGTIVHEIAELLSDKKHSKTYKKVVKKKDVFCDKALSRLINYHARRLRVDSEENLAMINEMAFIALNWDFWGQERGKPTRSLSEYAFDFLCDIDGKRYKVKGFIDRAFIYEDTKTILIRDYKTSKEKFKGHKISFNLQDYIYRLAMSKEYPDYNIIMEFLFLRFPDSPSMITEPISADALEGFEYYLTDIQNYLDHFTIEEAYKGFAKNKGYMKDGTFGGIMKCGKIGIKKDGITPFYVCPYRQAFNYYELQNEKGEVVKKAREDNILDVMPKKGQKLVEKKYNGCPIWWH